MLPTAQWVASISMLVITYYFVMAFSINGYATRPISTNIQWIRTTPLSTNASMCYLLHHYCPRPCPPKIYSGYICHLCKWWVFVDRLFFHHLGYGANRENRTLILGLENQYNNHYTISAFCVADYLLMVGIRVLEAHSFRLHSKSEC